MSEDSEQKRVRNFSGAVKWSAGSKYIAMLSRLGFSLVTARILSPEIFGIVAMAFVMHEFVRSLGNVGFAEYLVRTKELNQRMLSSIFWFNCLMCAGLALLTLASAPLLALMYGEPLVAQVAAVLSLYVFIEGFAIVPISLLRRELRFDKLAIREVGSVFVSGFIAVTLALAGFGIWSIVLSTIVGSIYRTATLYFCSEFRPSFAFDRPAIRDSLGFGINLTGAKLLNFLGENLDKIVIGIGLGAGSLGVFSLAQKLTRLPQNGISGVVNRVLLPRLARAQDNEAELAALYMRVANAIALISFPVYAVMMVLAQEAVSCLLGAKWAGASGVIVLLAPAAAMRTISAPRGSVIVARGYPRRLFGLGVCLFVVRVTGIGIGIQWGLEGLCIGILIASVISWLIGETVVGATISGAGLREQGRVLTPVVLVTFAAMLVGFTLRAMLISLDVPPAFFLLPVPLLMACVYCLIISRLHVVGWADILSLIPLPIRATLDSKATP